MYEGINYPYIEMIKNCSSNFSVIGGCWFNFFCCHLNNGLSKTYLKRKLTFTPLDFLLSVLQP